MLTLLEILIILLNLAVLIRTLLPFRQTPRWLDFIPPAAVVLLILHLFIDNEPIRFRMIPLYIITLIIFLVTLPRLSRRRQDRRRRKGLAAAGGLFGILILSAAVAVPVLILPFYPLPKADGSFTVGTVTCDLIDNTRTETFSSEDGTFREIAVQFWYPANAAASGSGDMQKAAVSGAQRTYPVVIFSHGAFGMRESNASTFRQLASHGYIVASIDHTYHALITIFPDGRVIPASKEFLNDVIKDQAGALSPQDEYVKAKEWLGLRTADIKFLLHSMESGELGPEGGFLINHMDLSRIGLFGHSLGGAAAAQVCRESGIVRAAIDIDGTMIGDIEGVENGKDLITNESFKKPLMLMYNSSFDDPEAKASGYLPNIRAYDNSDAEAYYICIKGSGHLNFTDLPRISPFLAKKLGDGEIDPLRCIGIMNDYVLAFFDKYLKGQESPLLSGMAKYGEVEFGRHIPEK